jgi:hypothetical protein
VKGQAVDLKATLDNCTKIFPDLFAQSPGTEQQVTAAINVTSESSLSCDV